MNAAASNRYMNTQVMTASPEQLQLMLFDGALRFARQARSAFLAGRLDTSCEAILRTQKIVMELSSSLRFDLNPELCKRLASLYTYIYRRLVDANLTRDTEALDEAIELLEHQRETWRMLMTSLAEARGLRLTIPVDAEEPAELIGVDVAG